MYCNENFDIKTLIYDAYLRFSGDGDKNFLHQLLSIVIRLPSNSVSFTTYVITKDSTLDKEVISEPIDKKTELTTREIL